MELEFSYCAGAVGLIILLIYLLYNCYQRNSRLIDLLEKNNIEYDKDDNEKSKPGIISCAKKAAKAIAVKEDLEEIPKFLD